MRIEVCDKDNYSIFINSCYVTDIDITSKDDLIKFIKSFILKIKHRLNLRGFYKVKVFPLRNVGVFFDLIKLDDMDISSNLDLRVIVLLDEKFYFETENYELIEHCNDKRYVDGKFYCIVDDSFNEVLEKVEWGRFIYGSEVINLLSNSRIL